MRFVTFSTKKLIGSRLGIVRDDEVVDIELAGRAVGVMLPDQMQDLIERYRLHEPGLRMIMDKAASCRFDAVKTYTDMGAVHDLHTVHVYAPIPRPRKNIMCVALNYSEHAKETAQIRQRSAEAPTIPVFFTKVPTTVIGPYDEIEINPTISSEIDWEAELGVVIGAPCKNVNEKEAAACIFGYTVVNDITARDLQARHKQYFKGKSLDGSCPMGPWIVTSDEVPAPQNLVISLSVNGIIKQRANTSQMIFPLSRLIAELSYGMTLEPGDIIATGTPSGVGFSRKPPEFLHPGDVMETAIEGIGVLRNPVVGSSPPPM